jgi:hypothetical protein
VSNIDPKQMRVVILFAVVCGVMGLGLACFGTFNAIQAASSLAWPTTEGQVLATDIDINYSSRNAGNNESYRPVIEYQYWVADQVYFSDQFSLTLDDHYGTRAKAGEVISAFELQSPLKVYYDPSEPSQSVLRTGLNLVTFIPCMLGALFLGFSVFVGIGLVRQRGLQHT